MPKRSAFFILLLALASTVRLHGLNQGFWYDEIWALKFFQGTWHDLLNRMPLKIASVIGGVMLAVHLLKRAGEPAGIRGCLSIIKHN